MKTDFLVLGLVLAGLSLSPVRTANRVECQRRRSSGWREDHIDGDDGYAWYAGI